jgi:hypothetical protein
MADRRNSELHTGAAAYESIDNSGWLPPTYEVFEVLLKHMKRDFADFLGPTHDKFAAGVLSDRRDTIRKEVQEKFATARRAYAERSEEWKAERPEKVRLLTEQWLSANQLRKTCKCPVCSNTAVMSGESVGRGPARVDEDAGTIKREVRVLPNVLGCPFCSLRLDGFQEMNEAGLGAIYTVEEEEDPIEFFGIDPEEHVDVNKLVKDYFDEGYQNE